jgi:hypothetical protein
VEGPTPGSALAAQLRHVTPSHDASPPAIDANTHVHTVRGDRPMQPWGSTAQGLLWQSRGWLDALVGQ